VLRWVSPNGLQTAGVLNNGQGVGNNVNSSVRAKVRQAQLDRYSSSSMVNDSGSAGFKDKQFDYLTIPSAFLESASGH